MSVQTRDREIVDLEHKRQAYTAQLLRELRNRGKRLPRSTERVLSQMVRPGRAGA